MSYILDALRKSEEERRKGELPGIQAYELPESEKKTKAKAVWGLVVLAAVLMNVVVLLVLAPWDTPIQPELTGVEVTAQPYVRPSVVAPEKHSALLETRKPVVPQFTPPQPVINKPAPSKRVTVSNYANKPSSFVPAVPEQPSTPQSYYLPQLSELPQHIQSQIPTLQFSSHMYSSQERFRSITINDRRLKQGQFYSEALFVKEITETGAILSFNETLFEVDVIGQWGN